MTTAASSSPRSITESPWYWAYLFCTGALIALVIIGPKYAQRQTQIEQNGQKRQWAAQLAAGRSQGDSPADNQQPAIVLWPLFVVLGLVLSIAWIKLIRDHVQRRAPATGCSAAVEAGTVEAAAVDGTAMDGGRQ